MRIHASSKSQLASDPFFHPKSTKRSYLKYSTKKNKTRWVCVATILLKLVLQVHSIINRKYYAWELMLTSITVISFTSLRRFSMEQAIKCSHFRNVTSLKWCSTSFDKVGTAMSLYTVLPTQEKLIRWLATVQHFRKRARDITAPQHP